MNVVLFNCVFQNCIVARVLHQVPAVRFMVRILAICFFESHHQVNFLRICQRGAESPRSNHPRMNNFSSQVEVAYRWNLSSRMQLAFLTMMAILQASTARGYPSLYAGATVEFQRAAKFPCCHVDTSSPCFWRKCCCSRSQMLNDLLCQRKLTHHRCNFRLPLGKEACHSWRCFSFR